MTSPARCCSAWRGGAARAFAASSGRRRRSAASIIQRSHPRGRERPWYPVRGRAECSPGRTSCWARLRGDRLGLRHLQRHLVGPRGPRAPLAATAATVGGGGVGGLFVPLVVAGALMGRLVGGAVGVSTPTCSSCRRRCLPRGRLPGAARSRDVRGRGDRTAGIRRAGPSRRGRRRAGHGPVFRHHVPGTGGPTTTVSETDHTAFDPSKWRGSDGEERRWAVPRTQPCS